VELKHRDRIVQIKIVYYGPPLGGKTTNLQKLHEAARERHRGEFISVNSAQDRTILFDLLPLKTPGFRGFDLRLQVLAVPGQPMYAATRRLVLRGVDGIVFVADSMALRQKMNMVALKDLRDNLATFDKNIFHIPLVFQFNKRDLESEGIPLLSREALENDLNKKLKAPSIMASALNGEGVAETMKKAISLTVASLEKRLDVKG
jgi:signal recognition particle receptor subunit beta